MVSIGRLGAAVLASVSVLGFTSAVEAYNTHGRWSKSAIPVPWHLNTEGMPYPDLAHSGAQQWSTNEQFDFGYKFVSNTKNYRNNRQNIVHMDDGRIGRGADGMTWWNNGNGGRIVWFNTGMQRNKRWTRHRFESVLTHELGHALGLLHTRDSSAIMWSSGGPKKIQPDDIRGARYLYPPSGQPRAWDKPSIGKPELIGPTGTSRTGRPNFTWKGAPNATQHQVFIDGVDPEGKQVKIVRSDPLNGTSFVPEAGLKPGKYFWWVRGLDDAGGKGEFANGEFEISPATEKPGAATVTGPGAIVDVLTPTITFDPAEHADGHDIYVDELAKGDSPRSKLLRLTNEAGSFVKAPELEPGSRYRVWVRGRNDLGTGPWSKGYSFEVSEDATEEDEGLPLPPTTPISEDPPGDEFGTPVPPVQEPPSFEPPTDGGYQQPPSNRPPGGNLCPRCGKPRCSGPPGRRRGLLRRLFGR